MIKTLLSIVIILIFTNIGGIISKKFKMPEVLGALIAGVIIGPVLLNVVQFDDNLKLLANLGVIMLMFLAGLETDVKQFKEAGFSSFIIALAGVVVPLVLGTIGAYLFFDNIWENLFIGVILTATSVSITVETLKELGKLNSNAGINILGAAVIDDILGLVLISIVLAMAQGSGTGGSGTTLTMLALFLKIIIFCILSIVGVIFLPKLINKMIAKVQPRKELLIFAIAFAFIIAAIAEEIGIAAITGAYIAGLILSSLNVKEYLEKNVKSISSGFLSPIFFASVGIEANLKGLNMEVLGITAVMFIVAIIGKLGGCGFAARMLKMSRSESIQIGTGMISRGEVALITANIGLQKGIISEEVFLPTLIVVILTTIVTPVLLKLTFSHKLEKNIDAVI